MNKNIDYEVNPRFNIRVDKIYLPTDENRTKFESFDSLLDFIKYPITLDMTFRYKEYFYTYDMYIYDSELNEGLTYALDETKYFTLSKFSINGGEVVDFWNELTMDELLNIKFIEGKSLKERFLEGKLICYDW